ncbi:Gfo/Idh/MocA family oxidoreductase [Arthrobacter tumbae]|uniref:Gfo/Idh/MocA family protein n=1 Tax=Arthrobacter tumbae TaxID=163874 RepID=UPI00195D63E2|nr:Gfo/Idh/MocA family oxidoreductase [Arthrobacter tumbae]MBM7781755.1 putative dehydrogenase [Arthrobacter tumbae]
MTGKAFIPARVAILGLGGRGAEAYGSWLLRHPAKATVVAVAELIKARRETFASRAGIPAGGRFSDWRELMSRADELALDAVIIALPDRDHLEPLITAVEKGIAVLLEKPIAPDPETLRAVQERIAGLEHRVAVAHVLRETPFWRSIKAVVDSGILGELATIRMEENIGFWHFAHSYVRGNWSNSATSSPMVLAKTSHDLDIIRWLSGQTPERVASFGKLLHFRRDRAPAGAPSHCVKGCPVSESCPFYAPRYYAEALKDVHGWPVALVTDDTTVEGRLEALAVSPYGRCVYRCENDVVDHQQSLFDFPSGLTATLTTSAFTGHNTRTFQITGSRGEMSGQMDSGHIRLERFAPEPPRLADLGIQALESTNGPLGHNVYEWTALPVASDNGDHRGHAGGDDALTEKFIDGVLSDHFDDHVSTTLATSLDSHWMAFAAEEARLNNTIIDFPAGLPV